MELDEIQKRRGHWAVVDLIGKGGHIRTVPIPEWVKAALDQWTVAAGVTEGRVFRAVARTGKVWGKGISQNVVWYVVKSCCERVVTRFTTVTSCETLSLPARERAWSNWDFTSTIGVVSG